MCQNSFGCCFIAEVIAGHDPKDATSANVPVPQVVKAAREADVKGMKIGVVKELNGDGYQAGVRTRFEESLELLAKAGAEIVEVSCPNFEYALAAYYLIARVNVHRTWRALMLCAMEFVLAMRLELLQNRL